MSVLVYVESAEGAIKKSSLEAVVYASKCANGANVTALVVGEVSNDELASLGNYGATKVLHAGDSRLAEGVVAASATVVAEATKQEGATLVVMARSSVVDGVAPRVGIKLNASVASNVVSLPNTENGFEVKRDVFSGKAFAYVSLNKDIKVITIKKNAIGIEEVGGNATVESYDVNFGENDFSLNVTSKHKAEGDVLLPEADIVVSAGRGLKGPENWGMIEDMAKTLGAATACSKPVSDMDWRPHHEHVGQTGIKVSPTLYFAVGISGAIQHLAGVNSSKVIVVINKDADAPFFKSADYGIIGDAFDVVPKLNEALKNALS